MYLAYALFCEGPSDYSYFEVFLPRVIESLVLKLGRVTVDVPERPAVHLGRRGRAVDEVAAEACDRREAFHIVFVHADTGGRGQLFSVNYFCRFATAILAGSTRRPGQRGPRCPPRVVVGRDAPSRLGRKAHNCNLSGGAGGVSPEGP